MILIQQGKNENKCSEEQESICCNGRTHGWTNKVGSSSTGCSLNIVFFSENFVIFLNFASSAAALVFYLPGVCTHTDTEGKQGKVRVWNIFRNSEKNTILNEHPVCMAQLLAFIEIELRLRNQPQ